jgi:hypothetical protein
MFGMLLVPQLSPVAYISDQHGFLSEPLNKKAYQRQSYLNHLKLARFDTRQFEKRTVSDITAIAPSSALLT